MTDDLEVIDRRFTFRGGNRRAFMCRDSEVLNESGAGTGKSFCLMYKSYWWARECPGAKIIWLRKERTALNVVLDEFEKEILWPGHPAMHGTAHYTGRKFYRFPNGSEIWLGGLDRADKLMSSKWDMVCVFEATDIKLDDWEKILSRLRSNRMPFTQAIADCNPKQKTHWLNQRAKRPYETPDDPALRAILPPARPGQTQMTRCRPRHEDNPAYHDGTTWTPLGAGYMAKLWSLTGHRRARLLEHKWVSAEGLVWPGYDPERHVVPMEYEFTGGAWYVHAPTVRKEPFRIWRFHAAGDQGQVHPGTLYLWALDTEGRLWEVHEAYHTGKDLEWWADWLYAWYGKYGIARGWYDAREVEYIRKFNNRISSPVGRDGRRIMRPAINAIAAGVNEVGERFKKREDGLCRIYLREGALVHEKDQTLVDALMPTCLEDELEGYMWEEQKATQDRPKDVPQDKDNHGCDPLRYVAMGVSTKDKDPTEPPGPRLNMYEADLEELGIGF